MVVVTVLVRVEVLVIVEVDGGIVVVVAVVVGSRGLKVSGVMDTVCTPTLPSTTGGCNRARTVSTRVCRNCSV